MLFTPAPSTSPGPLSLAPVRHIEVTNAGTGTESIGLHATQAHNPTPTITSNIVWTNKADPWTAMSPTRVTLKSGAKAIVSVTVKVPTNAPHGSSHKAVAWATTIPTLTSGIAMASGAGIREYLTVG